MRFAFALFGWFAAALAALPAAAQVRHTRDWPDLAAGDTPAEMREAVAAGPQLESGRTPQWLLEDHRRRARALDALLPQRKGVVDAYVVSIALDSDPVFGREAREAGKVLARRYDAAGRALVLAGPTGPGAGDALPNGSLESLALALARVAEVMDRAEDVLVLYATSHGAKIGIAYHDGDQGYGLLPPVRLAAMLDGLGIRNRVLFLSACYSGIFIQPLSSETTTIVTAASSDRTSFGCRAENDWTFFGDALVNHALRKPQPLEAAIVEARDLISGWELGGKLTPSDPQVAMGADMARILAPLEARMPATATQPVGAPATDALKDAGSP